MGFKVEDIEGKSLDDLFPQQAAEAYETDKQVISSKKSLRKIVCLDNIDGEPTWLQREKIPVMNQVNDCIGVLVFTQNIDKMMKNKNDLFKSQQMLQEVLETVPQRIFWKDIGGHLFRSIAHSRWAIIKWITGRIRSNQKMTLICHKCNKITS